MSEPVKYLSYDGLKTYTEQVKKYFANPELKPERVGLSTYASQLKDKRKIELIGDITGDGLFDGSSNITISTRANLSGSYDINVTGNADTATNFKLNKPINLTGVVTGYATGGTDANGWNITTSLEDSSVTNAKLAGNISNNKLQNSSITIGSTTIQLGGTVNTLIADVIGDISGNATTADSATSDGVGNVIVTTYATKAELAQISSAIRFVGSVPTFSALPATPNNGDIYSVEDENNKSYIWSDADQSWSVFGTSYGPATDTIFGLVKVGQNITNTAGTISLTKANVDGALGYSPISGVSVNGIGQPITNRVVDITIPSDYATQQYVDNAFNYSNITTGLGFVPVENVSVNGTDLVPTNRRVNIDLTDYATEDWTTEQIEAKLGSLYTFKGSVQTYGDLLNISGQSTGDTYNVITGNDPDTQEASWPSFSGGTNFSWDGDEWDSLGGSLDLSAYYKKTETDALLATKAPFTHNHNDLYYTQAQVNQMLSDLATDLLNQISTLVEDIIRNEKASGNMNDIRPYEDFDHFPGNSMNVYETPIVGVEYIDKATGLEYIWVETQEGGRYQPMNAIATDTDIDNIFS